MEWQNFRLSTRLKLSAAAVEEFYPLIAEIDTAKVGWRLSGKLLPQVIARLTHSVIVTSTGSSNRIEGNRLTDQQVEALYRNLHIRKFKTRDEQEVAGYLEMLERVFTHSQDISIRESSILQLHRDMLRHSEKDARHMGQYKFGSNRVEAKDPSGNILAVIFDPTPPHLVQKEMQELVGWYEWAVAARFKHPLLLIANFVFEYLAIHPFQDGNGRTSRLLTNLLLLQHGYGFAAVVSHEKLVEANKAAYYLALNKSQQSWKHRREDISEWVRFFLTMLQAQAREALALLEGDALETLLSVKQMALWRWAQSVPEGEFGRKAAMEALGYPARTVEAIIKKLVGMKRLTRIGEGRATRYRVTRR
jgi:Fic family protein